MYINLGQGQYLFELPKSHFLINAVLHILTNCSHKRKAFFVMHSIKTSFSTNYKEAKGRIL